MDKLSEILKNIEKVSIKEIEDVFSDYFLNHKRPLYDFNIETIYRARKIKRKEIEEKIKKIKDISYPNWNEIEKQYHLYNRCSDKGQNFFYGSNSVETIVKEIRPEHDYLLVLGCFCFKDINKKFTTQIVNIELDRKNGSEDIYKKFEFKDIKDLEVEKFISDNFKIKIKQNEEYRYKISIAISNILLKNENIHCIKYPSIANDFENYNYGIKPQIVDEYLFCKDVYVFGINIIETDLILVPIAKACGLKPEDTELNFRRFNQDEKNENTMIYKVN